MVKNMFQSLSSTSYGNQPSRSYQVENLNKTYKNIQPIKLSKIFLLLRACTFEKCPRDKKKKLIKTGTKRLENALDFVSFLRLSRSFNTFQRLFLSKDERRLLGIQRRHTVIQKKKTKYKVSSHSSSIDSDKKLYSKFKKNREID